MHHGMTNLQQLQIQMLEQLKINFNLFYTFIYYIFLTKNQRVYKVLLMFVSLYTNMAQPFYEIQMTVVYSVLYSVLYSMKLIFSELFLFNKYIK